eukprot:9890194-Alexandrium_andersonii.AAC.1
MQAPRHARSHVCMRTSVCRPEDTQTLLALIVPDLAICLQPAVGWLRLHQQPARAQSVPGVFPLSSGN